VLCREAAVEFFLRKLGERATGIDDGSIIKLCLLRGGDEVKFSGDDPLLPTLDVLETVRAAVLDSDLLSGGDMGDDVGDNTSLLPVLFTTDLGN
jgi:hypothetical protein